MHYIKLTKNRLFSVHFDILILSYCIALAGCRWCCSAGLLSALIRTRARRTGCLTASTGSVTGRGVHRSSELSSSTRPSRTIPHTTSRAITGIQHHLILMKFRQRHWCLSAPSTSFVVHPASLNADATVQCDCSLGEPGYAREFDRCHWETLVRENFSIAYFKFGTSSVFCRLVQAPYHPLRGTFCFFSHLKHFVLMFIVYW